MLAVVVWSMSEDDYLFLSGALIEIGWALKVIIAIMLVRWVWGLIAK